MGGGPSKEVQLPINLAHNPAAAKAHADAKKLLRDQKAQFQMEKEEAQEKLLMLQTKMDSDKNEAEKQRLRQEMDHQREMAERDQQVLREAMQNNEKQMEMMRDQMRIQDERFDTMREQHKEEMNAYREQNKRDIDQLVSTISSLNKEMEQIVYDPAKPDAYMQQEEQNFDKFCSAAAEHLKAVPKMKKKSVAVLGPSGVGKSTIINAFAGKHVTEIGLAECTDEVSMVYGDGPFDFYDVPGWHHKRAVFYNVEALLRADFYNVEVLHKLKSLHMVLLVCESRVDHVAKVAKLMVSINLPFIAVRNKCDFQAYSEKEWEDCKEAELRKLKMYTKLENPPLVLLGMSTDPKNGGDVQGLSELRGLMDKVMETL